MIRNGEGGDLGRPRRTSEDPSRATLSTLCVSLSSFSSFFVFGLSLLSSIAMLVPWERPSRYSLVARENNRPRRRGRQ